MSTEKHFGPEIVEGTLNGAVVRDRKAATALIVGTFPVHTVYPDASDHAAVINKPILIRRREDAAKMFGPHVDGYTIPRTLDAIFDQDQGKGVGTIEVINVFDPAVHESNGTPDVALVSNNDVIGVFAADGAPSGLKHAYASFQRYGWFPKIVGCPGFTLQTGVREELSVIANKIRSRSYIDAPAGVAVQDVIEARGPTGDFDLQTDSRRVIPCYPHMEAADPANDNATMIEPYSATMMGVHLATIMAAGYHHSPSNRPIFGRKPAQQVLYTPGFSDDDMQLLRGAGVVTAVEMWGKGPHTAGNRSAAYPSDTDMRSFIHAQFIVDMIDEGVLFFLDEYKDRNASPALLEFVEETINAWLRAKTVGTDPVLVDARFAFDRTRTTVQSYADGRVWFTLRIAPVGIMETLTVERTIDLDLLRNPLGLAA